MLEKQLSIDQQYQKSVQKLGILHPKKDQCLFHTSVHNIFSSSYIFKVRNEYYRAIFLMW
jgi:hypothetical protein